MPIKPVEQDLLLDTCKALDKARRLLNALEPLNGHKLTETFQQELEQLERELKMASRKRTIGEQHDTI